MSGGGGTGETNNLYWIAREDAAYRALNDLPVSALTVSASETAAARAGERTIEARVKNGSGAPVLAAKLTLLRQDGTRVLPAYYDDNYLSLMPGEERVVRIQAPAGPGELKVGVRGWNAREETVAVGLR